MEMMLNSAFAGTGNVMRISPESSNRLYAEVLGARVETSALGAIGAVDGAKHRIRALSHALYVQHFAHTIWRKSRLGCVFPALK
jgi:hypothetical protein